MGSQVDFGTQGDVQKFFGNLQVDLTERHTRQQWSVPHDIGAQGVTTLRTGLVGMPAVGVTMYGYFYFVGMVMEIPDWA